MNTNRLGDIMTANNFVCMLTACNNIGGPLVDCLQNNKDMATACKENSYDNMKQIRDDYSKNPYDTSTFMDNCVNGYVDLVEKACVISCDPNAKGDGSTSTPETSAQLYNSCVKKCYDDRNNNLNKYNQYCTGIQQTLAGAQPQQ